MLTDTFNVTVSQVNDSANLDNWYISQGLPTNGNSINCLFQDQIYWKIDTFPSGTPYGMWTFVYNNPGIDLNVLTEVDDVVIKYKRLVKIVDISESREENNKLLLYIYDDGSIDKKIILE